MPFVLILLRVIFIGLLIFIGYDLSYLFTIPFTNIANPFIGPILGFSIGILIIVIEDRFKPIFRKTTFAIIIGLTIGIIASYLLTGIIETTFLKKHIRTDFYEMIKLSITFIVSYLSVSTILQTKDRFKFIIPYFEFRSQKSSLTFLILDASALIDRRIMDLIKSKVFNGQIGLPRVVYNYLTTMSKDTDPQKRIHGLAGLQNYIQIKALTELNVEEIEEDDDFHELNLQIFRLAEIYQAKILTADHLLVNELKRLHIEYINIHEVAKAFHPPLLPGEKIDVFIIKAGDNKKQGVGYLEDATLIIVEEAKDYIGSYVTAEITQYLQKNTGIMYFANFIKVK